MRVWRRTEERYYDNCVREQDRNRGGGIMVWAGIDLEEKTNLIILEGNITNAAYVDQVINAEIVPLFTRRPHLTLMHDNARPHTARMTTDHLTNLGIPVLPWPAKSPDLNPIEHLWDELERRIRNRPRQPTSLQMLRNALLDEWRTIPRNVWRKVIFSMRQRCLSVIIAHGGRTKY